jgi:arylsulfatase A-like enzyme
VPFLLTANNWLPLEVDTFADGLKQLGYRSAFIGKWHLGLEQYYPVHHGFDEQFGVTDYGYPRGYYPPYFPDECKTYMIAPKDKYLTDRLTDDAVSFIENQNERQPFQLSLFYYGVHSPHQGRRDLVEKLKTKGLKGSELQHAAMVGAVDESVGRIREALTRRGIADNTMILFLGDQGGPFSNKPLRGEKEGGTALYEGGARIPFIVNWPGVVSPGSTTSEPVLTTDVFPTILDAAGGKVSDYQKLDGVSLMPLLTSKGKLNRDQIVLYRSYEDQYASIRSGKWKLIAVCRQQKWHRLRL